MSIVLKAYKYLSFINCRNRVSSKKFYSVLSTVHTRDNIAFKEKILRFRAYSVRAEDFELDANVPLQQHTTNWDLLNELFSQLDSDFKRNGRLFEGDVERVLTAVKEEGNVSGTQALALIKACGSALPEMPKEKRTQLMDEVWNILLKLNYPLDVSHYNALLKVHLDNEHHLDPAEFLSVMQKDVQPNRVTYQRLVSHYCQHGDMDGASKILEFMKLADFPMNQFIFNDLIMGNFTTHNVDGGKNIIELMRNAKVSIGSSTYASLACGYAKLGDITNVLATIEEATSEGSPLLDRDLLYLIYTLTVCNHGHLVEQVLPLLKYHFGYTQDCIATILELINKGFHKVGFILLNTMPKGKLTDGPALQSGTFFVKQLVKQDVAPDVVIDYCNKMKTLGLNEYALLKVTGFALEFQKEDAAITFLKELHSQNFEIRPHFFWPLLSCNRENEKGLFDILKLMADMKCPADDKTFVSHVFPYMSTSDPSSVIDQIKVLGYEENNTAVPLAISLIQNGDLHRVVELSEKYSIEICPLLSLSKAFIKSQDCISTVKILQAFEQNYDNAQRRNVMNNIYGQFLYHFAASKDFSPSLLEKLLLALEEKDVKIDTLHTNLQTISNKLDNNSRAQISKLLNKLALEVPKSTEKQLSSVQPNESPLIDGPRMLMFHASRKNLVSAEEILKELDEHNFTYCGKHYAVLIDLYSYHGDVEKALYYKGLLDKQFPDYPLKEHVAIMLATILVKNKKIDDAENLLLSHYTKHGCQEIQSSNKISILNLLTSLAESEEPQRTRTFLETLISYGYCKPEKIHLEPQIVAHLSMNQTDLAVEKFLRCVETYKCTPAIYKLFNHLILQNDTENLQTVKDAAITLHGVGNVLIDLALSFIDCGQLKQAKNLTETPGLRVTMEKLNYMCKVYVSRKKIKELEQFIEVTKNVFGLNKDQMYYHLLNAHVMDENLEGVLSVWEKIQEEDVQPSDETLHLLGTFLQKMNQTVPFTIPNLPTPKHTSQNQVVKEILERTNVEKTLNENLGVNLNDESSISVACKNLTAFLKKDLLEEALNLTEYLFKVGSYPNRNAAHLLAKKLANAGDRDSLLRLREKLPENIAATISFKDYIAKAYIKSGHTDEFLTSLENEVFNYKSNFPGGGLLDVLENVPGTLDRVKKLVDVYYQEGDVVPRNILWIHLMKSHRFDEAEEILESTPEMKTRLLFKSVIQSVKRTNDVELSEKLVDQAKKAELDNASKKLIYLNHFSALLEIQMVDEALKTLEDLQTIINFKELSYGTVHFLVKKLTEAGASLPEYLENARNSILESRSSSSDSSDHEKE